MQLETDLQRIARRTARDAAANAAFRRALKASRLSSRQLDAAVHALARRVAAAIDCTACGNCCRVLRPLLQVGDIGRLAAHLGLATEAFRAQCLQADDAGDGHWFRDRPCPFLRGNRCSVYAARPDACRSYPHLHKRDQGSRLLQLIGNSAVCPLAFNVLEGLKEQLWPELPDPEEV